MHKENSVSSPVVDCSVVGMTAWGMGTSFLAAPGGIPQLLQKETELLQKRYQQQSSMTVCSDLTQLMAILRKFTDTAKTYIGVPSADIYVRERARER